MTNAEIADAISEARGLRIDRKKIKLEDPIREFVEGIEDADPPDDAEDYHEQAVEHMRAYLEAVENRDQEALDELDAIEFPEAPADLEQRLSAAARENEECRAAGFAF